MPKKALSFIFHLCQNQGALPISSIFFRRQSAGAVIGRSSVRVAGLYSLSRNILYRTDWVQVDSSATANYCGRNQRLSGSQIYRSSCRPPIPSLHVKCKYEGLIPSAYQQCQLKPIRGPCNSRILQNGIYNLFCMYDVIIYVRCSNQLYMYPLMM